MITREELIEVILEELSDKAKRNIKIGAGVLGGAAILAGGGYGARKAYSAYKNRSKSLILVRSRAQLKKKVGSLSPELRQQYQDGWDTPGAKIVRNVVKSQGARMGVRIGEGPYRDIDLMDRRYSREISDAVLRRAARKRRLGERKRKRGITKVLRRIRQDPTHGAEIAKQFIADTSAGKR